MNLTLHELACVRNELIWAYVHPPGLQRKNVNRRSEGGTWVWYLKAGKLEFRHAGKITRLAAGQWLMLPEGQAEHRFSSDAKLLSIHYRSQWPGGDNLLSAMRPIRIDGKSCPALLNCARRLERFLRLHFPAVASHHAYVREPASTTHFLQLQMLFYAWLREWMENALANGAQWTFLGSDDERLLAAVRILNQTPFSRGLPMGEIMEASNLSEVQLNRLFTRDLGMTTRKYWEHLLMQQARDSLGGSDMPVKELAYRLGFGSDSLFVNWFRRREGKSPGQFRRENALSVLRS